MMTERKKVLFFLNVGTRGTFLSDCWGTVEDEDTTDTCPTWTVPPGIIARHPRLSSSLLPLEETKRPIRRCGWTYHQHSHQEEAGVSQHVRPHLRLSSLWRQLLLPDHGRRGYQRCCAVWNCRKFNATYFSAKSKSQPPELRVCVCV